VFGPEQRRGPEALIIPLTTLGLIIIANLGAFSLKTKKEIWKRDDGKSRLSDDTEDLECAHIDHSRSNSRYDDASNGRLLTKKEHLDEHINRAGRNGLPKHQNDWAINMLKKRAGVEDDD
jgi:hypothetical protein